MYPGRQKEAMNIKEDNEPQGVTNKGLTSVNSFVIFL